MHRPVGQLKIRVAKQFTQTADDFRLELYPFVPGAPGVQLGHRTQQNHALQVLIRPDFRNEHQHSRDQVSIVTAHGLHAIYKLGAEQKQQLVFQQMYQNPAQLRRITK